MATIKISNLNPAGSEFFLSSESYMNEISEGEINGIHGGSSNACWAITGYFTGKFADYLFAPARPAY